MFKNFFSQLSDLLKKYPELNTNATIHKFDGNEFVIHVNDGTNQTPRFSVQYYDKYTAWGIYQDGWDLWTWDHDGTTKQSKIVGNDIHAFTKLVVDLMKASQEGISPKNFLR